MGERKSGWMEPLVWIQICILLAVAYQGWLLRKEVDLLRIQMETSRAEPRVQRFQELVFRQMDLREETTATAVFLLDETKTAEEKYQALNKVDDEESLRLNTHVTAIWNFYEFLSLLYYEDQIDRVLAFRFFHKPCVYQFAHAEEVIDVLLQRESPAYSGWKRLATEFYNAAPQLYPGLSLESRKPR